MAVAVDREFPGRYGAHVPAHPPRPIRRRGRLAVAAAVLAAVGLAAVGLIGVPAAGAQTTIPPLQPITVTVNLNVATPSGVTGYRVDALCRNVPGTPSGDLNLSIAFGSSGGTGLLLFPLGATVSCAFRVVVQGSGPRPLAGNAIVVGGVARTVAFLSNVDGVAVDPSTAIQTDQLPVTAATTVLVGPTPTTSPTTSATSPATTTTTRPAAVVPPATAVVATAPPTTTNPATNPVTKPVYKRVCAKVRHKKCVAYRSVKV